MLDDKPIEGGSEGVNKAEIGVNEAEISQERGISEASNPLVGHILW